MKIQEIVSDVRGRVESAGKQYQGVLKAYVDAQRQAVGVMTKNGRTLAGTELGAAKNVFAAAKASFDKARADGVRQVARNPQTYVPNGRDQIISAYKDTIDVMVHTGNELTTVVSTGYKSMLDQFGSAAAKPARKSTTATRKKAASAQSASSAESASTTAAKKTTTATKSAAAKRKTASTRKTATNAATKRAKSNTTDDATTAGTGDAS